MENEILLMTACINPQGMANTALQDVEIRKKQYLDAVNYYLVHTHFNIIFVENSGFDISSLYQEYIEKGRIEVITYYGNNFDKKLGKGYGEGLIICRALHQSKLLHDSKALVIKVSGRHVVKNINIIVRLSSVFRADKMIACDINPKTRGANSDMFLATVDFYRYFCENMEKINEEKGIWFEHVLYDTIVEYCKKGGTFIFLPLPLKQFGVSGSMGTKFKHPSCVLYGKHILKFIMYKVGIKKI